jgi:hypothetical protein
VKKLILRTLSIATFAAAFAPWMHAQSLWSAPAIAGLPHIDEDGIVKTRIFDSPIGKGLRLRSSYPGLSYFYVPVNAPAGSTFKYMQLLAEDKTPYGGVKAELIGQPVAGNKPMIVLGQISTGKKETLGLQNIECAMNGLSLSTEYVYYIRFTILADASPNATAYNVGLSGSTRCVPLAQCGPCPLPW